MKRRLSILISILFVAITGVSGQTIEELRKEETALQENLRKTTQLLSGVETNQKDNRAKQTLVRTNITTRKKMIENLDGQISLINRGVNAKTDEIERLQTQLSELKREYAAMVRAAYKSQQTNNVLAFLFASQDFHDMTQRIFYIKRYTAMREHKAGQIDSVSVVLQADIATLALRRDSLDGRVRERNAELQRLDKEEQEYRRIGTSLASQARSYRTQLDQQQRQLKSIQDQIEHIIAQEARKSQATPRSAAEEEAFVLLTGRFDQNKGKLPQPVSGGVIIEKYGSHTHPTERNVTVNNKGVTFATPRGASVRSVFDGEVVRVFFTPGANNTVMIRHGNYFTTYSNLETVSVKAGDKVAINQSIGKVYSGPDSENYNLPFTIWNGTQTQNPELWLKR